jgi:hypothetical protein
MKENTGSLSWASGTAKFGRSKHLHSATLKNSRTYTDFEDILSAYFSRVLYGNFMILALISSCENILQLEELIYDIDVVLVSLTNTTLHADSLAVQPTFSRRRLAS